MSLSASILLALLCRLWQFSFVLTQEQLERRRHGIGASECPILADCDGYGRTLWTLYMSKVEGFSFPSSMEMELGNDLEAGVLAHYRRRMALVEQGYDLISPGTLFSKEYPWMFGTPDSVVISRNKPDEWLWNVQVKVVAAHKAKLFGDGPSDVPDHMYLQVQWEMAVANLQRTHLVALIGGVDFRVYTIDRDEETISGLRALGERFWQDHVVPKKPPSLDGSEAAGEYVKRMRERLKSGSGSVLEFSKLDEEKQKAISAAVERGLRARAAARLAQKEIEQARQELQVILQENRGVYGKTDRLSFSAQSNQVTGKVAWEKLARSLGATEEQIKQHRGKNSLTFVLRGSIQGLVDVDDEGEAV